MLVAPGPIENDFQRNVEAGLSRAIWETYSVITPFEYALLGLLSATRPPGPTLRASQVFGCAGLGWRARHRVTASAGRG